MSLGVRLTYTLPLERPGPTDIISYVVRPSSPFAEWNLKQRTIGACALLLFLAHAAPVTAAPPSEKFELRDSDRVAFLGNTFFEREHAHSYLETLLATRHPDRNVTFRNIAWSGDTVFGDARAAFDTRE